MPWYKQFWPWFLIAFPAIAVVAGIATMLIALDDPDGLVVSDYYRAGLAINQDHERRRSAQALGLSGALMLNGTDDKLSLQLTTAAGRSITEPATLSLRLVHPTRAQKDLSATLYKYMNGHLSGLLRIPQDGRWRVVIEPDDGAGQLSGALALPEQTTIMLNPS
jgi:hypothetical protein